jgi:hypothetical protein
MGTSEGRGLRGKEIGKGKTGWGSWVQEEGRERGAQGKRCREGFWEGDGEERTRRKRTEEGVQKMGTWEPIRRRSRGSQESSSGKSGHRERSDITHCRCPYSLPTQRVQRPHF